MDQLLNPFIVEFFRIKYNFWHFFKYCKLNDASINPVTGVVRGLIYAIAWPHLVKVVYDLEHNRKVIILKSKQIGISYIVAFYTLWKALTLDGFRCIIISKGENEAMDLLDKIFVAYDNLPEWLKLPTSGRSLTHIEFAKRGSSVRALASVKEAAVGKTVSLAIIDEHDFHPWPEQDWANIEPTAAMGQVICISTANAEVSYDSKFKKMWREAKAGLNGFYCIFLDYFARPDRNEDTYAEEEKNYLTDKDSLHKNYPRTEEEATSPISAKAFFDIEKLQTMLENKVTFYKPKLEDMLPPSVAIYEHYMPQNAYAISVDVSQGIEQDYHAIWVLSKRGNFINEAAVMHANDVKVFTIAGWIEKLARMYNYPLLAVEVNGIGGAVNQTLQELDYPNLYFRDDKREKSGWYTGKEGGSSRSMMLQDLANAIAYGILTIRYPDAIKQCIAFHKVEGRDGKVEIKSIEKHDDLVLSLAIGYQVIKKAEPDYTDENTPELEFGEEKISRGMFDA